MCIYGRGRLWLLLASHWLDKKPDSKVGISFISASHRRCDNPQEDAQDAASPPYCILPVPSLTRFGLVLGLHPGVLQLSLSPHRIVLRSLPRCVKMDGLSPMSSSSFAKSHVPTEKQCTLFLIIYHPQSPKVLLHTKSGRPVQNSPQMPFFAAKSGPYGPRFYEQTAQWIPSMQRHLRILFDVTLLRCVWYNKHHSSYCKPGVEHAILLCEAHGDSLTLPDGIEWMDPSCISPSQAVAEDARDAIELFLEECRTGVQPEFRASFARRGWYESAVTWMRFKFLAEGVEMTDKVTQVSCTYRGTILETKTSKGTAYLKCSPWFVNEALITERLAKLTPKFVAEPIATDIDRHLLLMKDCGEMLSPYDFGASELDQWANCLAELHQSTVGKEEALLDAGLRYLTVDVVEKEFDVVVDCVEKMNICEREITIRLKNCLEDIRRDCREVNEVGIPATFVHGDLHFSNFYRQNGSIASHGVLDFAEAIISHPFVDDVGGSRFVYHDNWIEFLWTDFPDVAEKASMKRFIRTACICTRLIPLLKVLRLFKELEAIRFSAPHEMLSDLVGNLNCSLINYESVRDKRQNRAAQGLA